jgi:hypothetical protein
MSQNTYRIRKAFVIPFALDTLLLYSAGAIWSGKGSGPERAVLAILFLVVLFVLQEAARRGITIGNEAFQIKKFLKTRTLAWSDLTHIGCLALRNRVYILLTTKKGFYVISNAYDRFPDLVQELIAHTPGDGIEIEEGAKAQVANPTRNISDIIAVWVAALVLASIIGLKITS